MQNIYIHLGLPKTGTTFLQEVCFPYLKEVHYIHPKSRVPLLPDGIFSRLGRIVRTNPLFLDLKKEREELDRLLQAVDEKTVLISNERIFGDALYNFHDNLYNAASLKYLFPAAKIIIVIRKQDDWLESMYKQCLRACFCPSIDSFLNYVNNCFTDLFFYPLPYPNNNARQLNLYKYVQNYVEMFGRENVIVLPYEMLQTDLKAFLNKLFDFMSIQPFYPERNRRVYRSYSLLSSHIAFLLNRFVRVKGRESRFFRFIPNQPFSSYLNNNAPGSFFYSILDKLNRRLSLNYVLEHVVDRIFYVKGNLIADRKRKLIMDIHRESNKTLDHEFNLGLKQYGYY